MKASQPKIDKKSVILPEQKPIEAHRFLLNYKWIGLGVFVLAFLLYANTLFFGFVQDDAIVITDNMYTTKGISGISGILSKDTFYGFFKESGKDALVSGGRYRPLSLVMFALVYQFFGGNPLPFHLLTILLYAATCVLLYFCFLRLLKNYEPGGSVKIALMAFIGAVIFTVHPVHTEVVANIKGCDEVLSLLGSLGALYLCLKAFDEQNMRLAWLAGLVFFAAIMSKENAFMFIFVIPLAFWMFRTEVVGHIFKHITGILMATIAFFAIRGSILGWKSFGGAPMELMNNPYLKLSGGKWEHFDASEKFATIFYTFGQYLKLLFAPFVLTHDYYPRHIQIMQMSNIGVLLSLAALIALLVFGFKNLQAQRPLRFGILLFLITLFIVSNIVFPIGTNMGERFIFMPSVGFALAVAALLADSQKSVNFRIPFILTGICALLLSVKTMHRNTAWESNEKLFLTDVQVSTRSAKLQNSCGGTLYEKALTITDPIEKKKTLEKSVAHLKKALEIHPTYKNAYLLKANSEFYLEQYEDCIKDYQMALQIDPNYKDAKKNLAIALRDAGKYEGEKNANIQKAMDYLSQSIALDKNDPETLRLLGVANGVAGNHPVAVEWFSKAVVAAPNNAMLWYDLSMACKYTNDIQKSNEALQKALQLDPNLVENLKKRK